MHGRRVISANRKWRLKHLADYREALTWLREEAQIVDTTGIEPPEAARLVAESAGALPPRDREQPGSDRSS